jgi:hypothetical protein
VKGRHGRHRRTGGKVSSDRHDRILLRMTRPLWIVSDLPLGSRIHNVPPQTIAWRPARRRNTRVVCPWLGEHSSPARRSEAVHGKTAHSKTVRVERSTEVVDQIFFELPEAHQLRQGYDLFASRQSHKHWCWRCRQRASQCQKRPGAGKAAASPNKANAAQKKGELLGNARDSRWAKAKAVARSDVIRWR